VLPEQVAQAGVPAHAVVEQHELLVAQSFSVHGQHRPDGFKMVPSGQRELTGGVHAPESTPASMAQPAGHTNESAHPTRPLQLESTVLEQSSGPGSWSPVHGPKTPNSPCWTHVCVPSWQVPWCRLAGGPE
jgi:hypothetical protein